MSRLDYVHAFRRIPAKRRPQARSAHAPLHSRGIRGIAAEARCLQNACTIESTWLTRRSVLLARDVWTRAMGPEAPGMTYPCQWVTCRPAGRCRRTRLRGARTRREAASPADLPLPGVPFTDEFGRSRLRRAPSGLVQASAAEGHAAARVAEVEVHPSLRRPVSPWGGLIADDCPRASPRLFRVMLRPDWLRLHTPHWLRQGTRHTRSLSSRIRRKWRLSSSTRRSRTGSRVPLPLMVAFTIQP